MPLKADADHDMQPAMQTQTRNTTLCSVGLATMDFPEKDDTFGDKNLRLERASRTLGAWAQGEPKSHLGISFRIFGFSLPG